MKTSLRPEKSEERGEDVVKMTQFRVYKFIIGLYHVRTMSTLRPYKVLTTSIAFPLGSYYADTTFTPFLVRF